MTEPIGMVIIRLAVARNLVICASICLRHAGVGHAPLGISTMKTIMMTSWTTCFLFLCAELCEIVPL